MASVFCRRFCQKSPQIRLKFLSQAAVVQRNFVLFSNLPKAVSFNLCQIANLTNKPHTNYSCKFSTSKKENENDKEQKPSIFQRFKQMYRDYWYVLVPVHLITSAAWFGGFYYLAKSGIDVVCLLESWHVSDKLLNPLRDSSMGYLAISYALYKIATPIRYTVTLGGTTVSINYLKKWGYIRPMPNREELKEIYQEKKDNLIVSMKDKHQELKNKKTTFEKKLKVSKEKFASKNPVIGGEVGKGTKK